MCRLLGILSDKKMKIAPIYKMLSIVLKMLCVKYGECHGHGCGVAWLSDNSWVVRKYAQPLWESEIMENIIREVKSKAYIMHARKSTFPVDSLLGMRGENSHPFIHTVRGEQFVFAHNGYVVFDESKISVNPSEKLLEFNGRKEYLTSNGTDSEIFFRILLASVLDNGLKEPDCIICALEDILNGTIIKDFRAINFVMGSEKYMYALRYYNEDYPDSGATHTLYYLMKNQQHGYKTYGGLYISSEPLTGDKWIEETKNITGVQEEKWTELKNRYIIYVPIDNPREIHVTKLHV